MFFVAGAANIATYRLLKAYGVDPKTIAACDSKGILASRPGGTSNASNCNAPTKPDLSGKDGDRRTGGPEAAFTGADVCIAFSRPGPGAILPEWVRAMARDAAVLATAIPCLKYPEAALQCGRPDSCDWAHASPTVTLNVYGHLFSNTDDRAAEITEAAFSSLRTD